MTTIQVGDWIKDNDPRRASDPARQIVNFDGVDGPHFTVYGNKRRQRIREDRIFLDGKKRSQGWNLVPAPSPISSGDTAL
jgi:hypothetical protein